MLSRVLRPRCCLLVPCRPSVSRRSFAASADLARSKAAAGRAASTRAAEEEEEEEEAADWEYDIDYDDAWIVDDYVDPNAHALITHGEFELRNEMQRSRFIAPLKPYRNNSVYSDISEGVAKEHSLQVHHEPVAPKDVTIELLTERLENTIQGLIVEDGWGLLSALCKILDIEERELREVVRHWRHKPVADLQRVSQNSSGLPVYNADRLRAEFLIEDQNVVIYRAVLQSLLEEASRDTREVFGSKFRDLLGILDLRRPEAMFPEARKMHRRIIMHVGPTNSGKTYNALLALSQARRGFYAAPLRLLANQAAQSFNTGKVPGLNGVPRACNLITGEEVKIVDQSAGLHACTVEMTNTVEPYDVAVIDEIQLMSDPQRGSAWTTAVLGARAKELHLCGEASAVPILEKMVESTHDSLEVKHYERLGPLHVENEDFRDHGDLRPGDCIVMFSRKSLYWVKEKIEGATQFKVAIIYGALPSEAREREAQRFNSGEADILLATDAIGLGMNLAIRRVIFAQMRKPSGGGVSHPLSARHIKQIAGRAGRYGVERPQADAAETPAETDGAKPPGLVTAFNAEDRATIRDALQKELPGLAVAFQDVDLEVYRRLRNLCSWQATWADLVGLAILLGVTRPPYYVSSSLKLVDSAELVSSTQRPMSLREYNLFNAAPLPAGNELSEWVLERMMDATVREGWPFDLTDFYERELEIMAKQKVPIEAVRQCEDVYGCLTLYAWLAHRDPLTYPELGKAVEFRNDLNQRLQQLMPKSRGLFLGEKKQKKEKEKKAASKGSSQPEQDEQAVASSAKPTKRQERDGTSRQQQPAQRQKKKKKKQQGEVSQGRSTRPEKEQPSQPRQEQVKTSAEKSTRREGIEDTGIKQPSQMHGKKVEGRDKPTKPRKEEPGGAKGSEGPTGETAT